MKYGRRPRCQIVLLFGKVACNFCTMSTNGVSLKPVFYPSSPNSPVAADA